MKLFFAKSISLLAVTLFVGVLQGEEKPYPHLKEVIVIYKTHFDIGYSDLARNVVHKYRTEMLDHALSNIEVNAQRPQNEQFVWTIPGWPMEQILWKGQEPERRAQIEKALQSGNLVIHALPYTMHTETLELEELVRGLGYSSSISKQYNLPLPRDSKMTDVPSHTWVLPTLLKKAGVDFFHFGCNLTNKMPEVPTLFWWEGPDGSRLLTMASQGYGTSALPPKDWPYSAWIYISQTGDNEGPPSPDAVKRDLEFYQKHVPDVKVKIGRLSDFSDAIQKEKNPEIPVVRGDMPDTWVHGPMCSPKMVSLSRHIRPMIAAAENLQTLSQFWGVFLPDETDAYRKAYEQSLMFGEHTWGLAAQHYRKAPYSDFETTYQEGYDGHLDLLEESWDEHDQYIQDVNSLIKRPLANEIACLADNVSQEGQRIVVYNPLPWSRTAETSVNLVYWPQAHVLKDVATGEHVPVKTMGAADEGGKRNVIGFTAKDVPAMGYKTYVIDNAKIEAKANISINEEAKTIESPFFKATLDPQKGAILSLINKATGEELVDAEAPQGFASYLYERFSKKEVSRFLDAYLYPQFMGSHGPITDNFRVPADVEYQSATLSDMTLKFEENPLEVTAVMTGKITQCGMPQWVTVRLTLYNTLPYADVEVSVDKKPEGWPEAGWVCFPFRIQNPKYRIGRLGSIIDPMKDILPNCNARQIWTNSGVALYNAQGGVGVCPIDSPLISLGEPGAHHFDKSYKPQKPYLYVNLYNNQWQTNFREFWGGKLSSKIRLWGFKNFDPESSLISPALEARTPVLTARSSRKPGKLPTSQSGIELSRKGIALTSFAKNPDGEGLVLRLWEQAGSSGPCTITLPPQYQGKSVQPINLRGEKLGDPIPVEKSQVTIDVSAYAPVSLLLN